MKILTDWLRWYLPSLAVDDRQLAEDLTLRGIAVEGIHPAGAGSLFEMDITTNRVDAMNHYGVAREAAAIYDLALAPLLSRSLAQPEQGETGLNDMAHSGLRGKVSSLVCEIDPAASAFCGRFTAQVLRGVAIAPSTGQVAAFFEALGQRRISNAVDASNFTLLGMGHPTHAFDLDTIEGGIVVRLARPGERLRLLDGSERTLEPDDLVIADHVKALSLAGVMGGWDSRVTEATKNVLVESAWFDPAAIRRSSRRHLLHTDASHRFERGADFNATPTACILVADILLASGGARDGRSIDLIVPEWRAKTASRPPVHLSLPQVTRVLGQTVAPKSTLTSSVPRYLTALGCTLQALPEESFEVTLPSWRLDLEREIDLIEEVARVYGYNGFANTLPAPGVVLEHPRAKVEARVRHRLLALGFTEALSSSFASETDGASFGSASLRTNGINPASQNPDGKNLVPLENPLSDEAKLLRPSLVPGMLTMIGHNLNRDVKTVRLFEQGQVFRGSTERVDEHAALSLGLTGGMVATSLYAADDAGFYELKGAVESLLSLFEPASTKFVADAPVWLAEGRRASVTVAGKHLAVLGELAPEEAARRKLKQPVWIAELDLETLYALPLRQPMAADLSPFQAVERDFSFIFAQEIAWSSVAAAVEALQLAELVHLAPLEVFRDPKGKALPIGHQALLFRCVFQSLSRTLAEQDLTGWSAAIVAALTSLGGVLRA